MGWPPSALRESTPAEFAAAVAGYSRAKGGGGDELSREESDALWREHMAIEAESWLKGEG